MSSFTLALPTDLVVEILSYLPALRVESFGELQQLVATLPVLCDVILNVACFDEANAMDEAFNEGLDFSEIFLKRLYIRGSALPRELLKHFNKRWETSLSVELIKQKEAEQFASIKFLVDSNCHLSVLKMSNCSMGYETAEILGRWMVGCSDLEQLELESSGITNEYFLQLFRFNNLSCQCLTNLMRLSLKDNEIESISLNLWQALTSNCKRLESLDLSLNNLDDDSGQGLLETLQSSLTLRNLTLDGNNLGSKSASALGSLITTSRAAEKISVARNDLVSVQGIVEAVCRNKILRFLDVSCQFGELATISIATLLQKNATLKYLKCSGKRTFADSALELSAGLLLNSTLVHLDISQCFLSPGTIPAIGNVLSQNTCLLYLGLAGMDLGDNLTPVVEGMATNHTLLYLMIQDNFAIHATKQFPKLVLGNKLQYLNISNNSFTVETYAEFGLMPVNTSLKTLCLRDSFNATVGFINMISRPFPFSMLTDLNLRNFKYDKNTLGVFKWVLTGTVIENLDLCAISSVEPNGVLDRDEAVLDLAQGLAVTKTLKRLSLHEAGVPNAKRIRVLTQGLRSNSSLEYLGLITLSLERQTLRRFLSAFVEDKIHVTALELGRLNVDESVSEALKIVLTQSNLASVGLLPKENPVPDYWREMIKDPR